MNKLPAIPEDVNALLRLSGVKLGYHYSEDQWVLLVRDVIGGKSVSAPVTDEMLTNLDCMQEIVRSMYYALGATQ